MHATLQRAERFEDLLALPNNDTPYLFNSIFAGDGFFARRLARRKLQLLKRIDARLSAMLAEGERVRYLTFGSGTSFWESYFLGYVAYFLNQRAIVLTDRRILMLQIDWRQRPRELLSQIRYPSIARIKRTMLGNTLVHLNDGSKRIFGNLPKKDRKLLQSLGARVGDHVEANAGGMDHLCPHCYVVVAGRPTRCAACGGTFKSARKAALLSLLLPGLGDFYLGHWKFAILETGFALFVWVAIFLSGSETPLDPVGVMIVAALLLLFMHIPDALATRYIARKGIYPAAGGSTMQPAHRVGAAPAPAEATFG